MYNSPMVNFRKSENLENKKFWGLFLPVAAVIAVVNSIFWDILIFNAIGLGEAPKTEREKAIIQEF